MTYPCTLNSKRIVSSGGKSGQYFRRVLGRLSSRVTEKLPQIFAVTAQLPQNYLGAGEGSALCLKSHVFQPENNHLLYCFEHNLHYPTKLLILYN